MVKRAIIRTYNAGTHTTSVELLGLPGAYLSNVPVSHALTAASLTNGTACLIEILDATNPLDAVVTATYGTIA